MDKDEYKKDVEDIFQKSNKYKTFAEKKAFLTGCLEGMKSFSKLMQKVFSTSDKDNLKDMSQEDYWKLIQQELSKDIIKN